MAWTPSAPLPGLIIRPPVHGERGELLDLLRDAFEPVSQRRVTPTPGELARMVVADLNGLIVGVAASGSADRGLADRVASSGGALTVRQGDMVLTALAVLPHYRRRGIARRLAEARIEAAEISGAHHVFVHCVEGAGTEELYRSLGFTVLSRWVGHYRNGADMTLMVATLPR